MGAFIRIEVLIRIGALIGIGALINTFDEDAI